MNHILLIITIGLCYVVVWGGLTYVRREGLSSQTAFEVLGLIALVVIGELLTGTQINPVLFLVFIYLVSMRGRLLVDMANLLSARGRQRNAISLLQFALRLYPDHITRKVIVVNMGIVQLRRKSPESAQTLFQSVLEQTEEGGLGIKYEAACRYNLGLALQKQGKEAQAVHQYNQAISIFPNSIYGKASQKALDQRRKGIRKAVEETPREN